ncbi:hypothetical protein C0215_19185, partial [Clostridioides difficile]
MFPEQSSPLQNAAPRSEFCAVAEIGPPRLPSQLAKGALMGLCKHGLFMPNQPSPRRRTRVELVSSTGDHPT